MIPGITAQVAAGGFGSGRLAIINFASGQYTIGATSYNASDVVTDPDKIIGGIGLHLNGEEPGTVDSTDILSPFADLFLTGDFTIVVTVILVEPLKFTWLLRLNGVALGNPIVYLTTGTGSSETLEDGFDGVSAIDAATGSPSNRAAAVNPDPLEEGLHRIAFTRTDDKIAISLDGSEVVSNNSFSVPASGHLVTAKFSADTHEYAIKRVDIYPEQPDFTLPILSTIEDDSVKPVFRGHYLSDPDIEEPVTSITFEDVALGPGATGRLIIIPVASMSWFGNNAAQMIKGVLLNGVAMTLAVDATPVGATDSDSDIDTDAGDTFVQSAIYWTVLDDGETADVEVIGQTGNLHAAEIGIYTAVGLDSPFPIITASDFGGSADGSLGVNSLSADISIPNGGFAIGSFTFDSFSSAEFAIDERFVQDFNDTSSEWGGVNFHHRRALVGDESLTAEYLWGPNQDAAVALAVWGPSSNKSISVSAGTYAFSGAAVSIIAVSYELSAGAGSYAFTGTDATFSIAVNIDFDADAGSYSLTGSNASLVLTKKVNAGAGSYNMTGTSADISIITISSILTEDGDHVLTEDGDRILTEG